jgi:hypothetical protein
MESDLLKHNSAPHAFRSLGTLDVLPLELQHEILRQLVLRNITTFKSLNSRSDDRHLAARVQRSSVPRAWRHTRSRQYGH